MRTNTRHTMRTDSSDADKLRSHLNELLAENTRLRSENARLRSALHASGARARPVPLFGADEMTAATCVGPRRHFPAAGC